MWQMTKLRCTWMRCWMDWAKMSAAGHLGIGTQGYDGYWATAAWREEDGLAVSWSVNGNYGTLDPLFSSKETYEAVFEAIGPPAR